MARRTYLTPDDLTTAFDRLGLPDLYRWDAYPRRPSITSHNLRPQRIDIDSGASIYSGETAVYSSSGVYSTGSISPQSGPDSATTIHRDINISLMDGQAHFDYLRDGELITPRSVREMLWCSEQSVDAHEFIVLRIEDASQNEVWVRFKAYSGGGVMGDMAYTGAPLLAHTMSPHASITFENGIDYQAVMEVRNKTSRMHKIPADGKDRAFRTAEFVEMLSLHIGKGVGLCMPQDLCEIWPSMPTFDRRLFELCWYELADGSGTEFLVLLIEGSSNLLSGDEWWVRLERVEMSDHAAISTNSNAVIHPGSELKHKLTFNDGMAFEKVIGVLRSVPIGLNAITEDCWYFASTISHKLIAEVGEDIGECSVRDLREFLSGERGSQLLVNRIQSLQEFEAPGIPSEFLLLNISETKYDRHGLWVRLGKSMGGNEDWASISQNRRRLMSGTNSNLLADLAFEALKFGNVLATLSQMNSEMNAKTTQRRGTYHVIPHEIIKRISQQHSHVYWIKGN
ncbi:unnamed protein product [Rhizoctonia solani]|uniref:Uncharacterized protein n=1 Tax=Rhizoctonia solani TaxID=456999 RepID=A0A8H3DYR6_9AGAM|nr:unnamed protein product [Rhizoctonia solani]